MNLTLHPPWSSLIILLGFYRFPLRETGGAVAGSGPGPAAAAVRSTGIPAPGPARVTVRPARPAGGGLGVTGIEVETCQQEPGVKFYYRLSSPGLTHCQSPS